MFQRLKPWNCEHISSQNIFSVNPGAQILSVLYAHNHIQDAFYDAQSVRLHAKTSTSTTDREWPNICVSINSMQSKVRVKCGEDSFKDDREKHLFLAHFYVSESGKSGLQRSKNKPSIYFLKSYIPHNALVLKNASTHNPLQSTNSRCAGRRAESDTAERVMR